MKTLLAGCGCLFLLLVLAIGGCGYFTWKSVKDIPADAKRDTLYATHRSLIDGIDGAIRAADSFANAAERIKPLVSDSSIVYVRLAESGGTQQLDIVKRISWEGNSTMIWNGAGTGSLRTKLGTQDIRIIQSSERTSSGMLLEYTVYVAHGQVSPLALPAPSPATENVEKSP